MTSGTVYGGTMAARLRIPPNSLLGASKQQLLSPIKLAPQNSNGTSRQHPAELLQKSDSNFSAARTKTAAPKPAFEAKAGHVLIQAALELRLQASSEW